MCGWHQGAWTVNGAPAGQRTGQMLAKEITEPVGHVLDIVGSNRILTVAIQPFISTLKTILECLVREIDAGHGIASGGQNIPTAPQRQIDLGTAYFKFTEKHRIGGSVNNRQQVVAPIRRAHVVSF